MKVKNIKLKSHKNESAQKPPGKSKNPMSKPPGKSKPLLAKIPGKSKKGKKKEDFFDRVYKLVAKIPYGKVTTYGHIAEACGIKSSARTVGWALNGTKESGLPCHRVVNRFGALTGRMHFGSSDIMQELLQSEGVEFNEDGFVLLEKYLWIPPKKR